MRALALLVLAVALSAFGAVVADSTQPAAPRDSLSRAVEDARGALAYSGRGYEGAAERFRDLTALDGGALERAYDTQAALYREQSAAAARVRARVDEVEAAGQALFAEWEAELGQYAADSLRAQSRARFGEARQRYDRMLAAMREAERAAAPALAALRDRTLALKHALNARAVGALDGTATAVRVEADAVREATARAVAEADRFLAGPEAN
jgi:hypothetical protein